MVKIFLAQILTTVAFIYFVFTASLYQYLICVLVYFLFAGIGGTITFHRLLSHRSWKAPRVFELIGSTLGCLGLSGSGIAWAAVHRQHHIHSDTHKDPHSPVFKNPWKVQFLSMYYKPNLRYVRDLLRDPYQVFLHRNYFKINFAYSAVLFTISPQLAICAHLAPAFLTWQLPSLINSFSHKVNKSNEVEITNNFFLALLTFGEGWHKNHHLNPNKSNFSANKFQFDLGYFFIKLLKIK